MTDVKASQYTLNNFQRAASSAFMAWIAFERDYYQQGDAGDRPRAVTFEEHVQLRFVLDTERFAYSFDSMPGYGRLTSLEQEEVMNGAVDEIDRRCAIVYNFTPQRIEMDRINHTIRVVI